MKSDLIYSEMLALDWQIDYHYNRMMNQKLAKHISESISVTDKELLHIMSHFHRVKVGKNELLVTDGQVSQRMYFVAEGCLRVYFIKEDGQEATRYLAFENQFATALVSFITKEASLEFIEAVEETTLFYITQYDFQVLLNTYPQWETFYRKYLEIAYVNNTNRLMSFITMDATERYTQLLKQNPIVVRRLPNKLVANYLNISQETLSRLKSKVFYSQDGSEG